jgi:hypothetical protein
MFKNIKGVDLSAILLYIVSVGTEVASNIDMFTKTIDSVTGHPGSGARVANIVAALTLGCGLLLRLYANKTDKPTTSIVSDAKVVPPETIVTTAATPSVGTNVSTTSTLSIAAPSVGANP